MDVILIKTAFLSTELLVDGIFSTIVFVIFYNSIKFISRNDYSSRMQSIIWLGVFAFYQFLHLFHMNDCNLYALTNNLVNLAFIIAIRNTWSHHYELKIPHQKHRYAQGVIKTVNTISAVLLLFAFPLMLQINGLEDHYWMWGNDLLIFIIIPIEFINLIVISYLMNAHLHIKKIFLIILFQLLGLFSYILAPLFSIQYATGNVLLIVSYIIFFDLYFVNEMSVKVRYERNEKNEFFELFLDNPDIFLILQEDDEKNRFFIANANRAAENKFGKKLDELIEVPELLFDMTHSNFKKWMMSNDEFLLDLQLSYIEKPFIADISKKRIKMGDSIWILINIRSVEERVESSKKINIFEEVYKNAVEAMLVADKNLKIIWVNDEYVKYYGYTREELIGKTPNIVKSDKHTRDFYQAMWCELGLNNKWKGEFYNKKKNGELIKVMQSIVHIKAGPFLDDYYISVASDLSEKMAYENRLFELAYLSKETGLFNRAYLENNMSDVEYDTVVAIRLNDIDYVKTALGERIGKVYLQEIINRLKVHCHKEIYEYNSEVLLFFCNDEFTDCDSHIKAIDGLYECLRQKIEYEEELGLPDISVISSLSDIKPVSIHLNEIQKTLEYIKISRQKGIILLNEELKKLLSINLCLVKNLNMP